MTTYKITDLPQNTTGIDSADVVVIVDTSEDQTQRTTVKEMVSSIVDSDFIQANIPEYITDFNFIQSGRIDLASGGTLNARIATADFEGSTVNFNSASIMGLSPTINNQIDTHLNKDSATQDAFLKWNGTDYQFTNFISGRLATDQLEIDIQGSINARTATLDFRDTTVLFSGATVGGLDLSSGMSDTVSAPNYREGVYIDSATSGTVQLTPETASIQMFIVSSTTTFDVDSASFLSGESMTMHIKNVVSSPITWASNIKWVGGSSPSLNDTNGTYFVSVWRVADDFYGAYAGRAY